MRRFQEDLGFQTGGPFFGKKFSGYGLQTAYRGAPHTPATRRPT
jgi:hypothetical protein